MEQRTETKNRYRIEALAKGLQVLNLFDEEKPSMRIAEIAERTGIPLPTTFRVVATLEEFEYLERRPDGSVCPGLGVLRLGTASLRSSSLLEAAQRPMHRLAERTGETVNLGILVDDHVLYVARLRNRDLVTANLDVGSKLPAAYTSMGKMLLALLDPADLDSRLSAHSFPDNANTNAFSDAESLKLELARIREAGYATQDEELAVGLRSMAVPVITNSGNAPAAMNIAVIASQYSLAELVDAHLGFLQDAAEETRLRLQST